MLNYVRSIGIAVVFAVVGVVAMPASGAQAGNLLPIAYISPQPDSSGTVPCEPGTKKTFSGRESYSSWLSMDFHWQWPGGEARGRDLFEVEVPCPSKGEFELSLWVDNSFGTSVDTVRVAANEAPTAVVSFQDQPQGPVRIVALGSTVTFGAELSSDPEKGPMSYWWTTDPSQGATLGPRASLTCAEEGLTQVVLTVTDQAGLTDSTSFSFRCYKSVEASFSPEPAGRTERTMVPLNTVITFTSDAGRYSELVWRTTGVPGVAATGRQYTRRFDQPGNFGVELTESSPIGQFSRWAGYTVVAPPTVSVTPAPPGLTDRMTVVKGSRITFNGSGSYSSAGALTYEWRTTGLSGVVAGGQTYARTFNTVGNFGVELTVIDQLGQRSKRWVGLTVVPS